MPSKLGTFPRFLRIPLRVSGHTRLAPGDRSTAPAAKVWRLPALLREGQMPESWVTSMIKGARRVAASLDRVPEDWSLDRLDRLEEHEWSLATLTKDSLLRILAWSSVGKTDYALLDYLENHATLQERRAASHESTAETHEDRESRDAIIQDVLELMAELGEAGIRYLLPLLLVS